MGAMILTSFTVTTVKLAYEGCIVVAVVEVMKSCLTFATQSL